MNRGTEIELKLLIAPRAAARLVATPPFRGRLRSERLRAVYYDTPRLALRRRGLALRVRRESGRWVQTVKGEGAVLAGLAQRAQSECVLPSPRPDPARSGLRGLSRARLVPVFETRFARASCTVSLGGGAAAQAAFDRGEIRARGASEPVSELELELKSGPPAALYRFATRLLAAVPLRLGTRSKAERGYALALGERCAPVKARPAPLAPGASTDAACRELLAAALRHLQANEDGALEGRDPEFLHQARVALRRLRSTLGLFRPLYAEPELDRIARELRWLARALGPARDWDVFFEETLPRLSAAGVLGPGTGAARWRRERERAKRRARAALASRRYQRLVLRLAAWLQSAPPPKGRLAAPARVFARRVLQERLRQVRKLGRDLSRLDSGRMHRLRIAVKKLRYAAEGFAPLYPGKRARALLRRLARLQDVLGAIQDAATAVKLAQRAAGARGQGAGAALPALRHWRDRRIAALAGDLARAWAEWRRARPFW